MYETTDRQVELEKEMREHGLSRYHKNIAKKVERGQEANTDYGQYLLRQQLRNWKMPSRLFYMIHFRGKAGRAATAAVLVDALEPAVTAVITLRVVLNQITRQRAYSSASIALGMALEDEIRIRCYEENNPGLFKVVMRDLDGRSQSYTYKRKKIFETGRKQNISGAYGHKENGYW